MVQSWSCSPMIQNVLITDSDVGGLQSKIDRVMTELESWFNRNSLIMNVGKTVVMSFHNRQSFW
jgi:hypothetical protein